MLSSAAKVRVRGARVGDAKALAQVFRESWSSTYQGIIPQPHLDALVRRRTQEWWRSAVRSSERMLVVEVAGEIAGYATYGPARTRDSRRGEIYELYLTPRYQGLGFGEYLFEGCRHMLDLMRRDGLIVWALADNHGACDFYWRRGGRPKACTREAFGKVHLEKIAYTWP
ncbi:MAG: GNAT family N-acetyltransferase [Hyphomicrobiales bacterium]|nr:GNAT family N-acetyltransferase [Hyphomicrobiales bacterium]